MDITECGQGINRAFDQREDEAARKHQEARTREGKSLLPSSTGSALIGECDTCGNITAIDLDDTPEHWKEMQHPGRTVKRLPKDEALAVWRERGKRCDHKALIAELRARVAPNAWWPENPYPESLFPMTTSDYALAIPDPTLRTAISGCIARFAWEAASQTILERMRESQNDKLTPPSAARNLLSPARRPSDEGNQKISKA